MWFSWACGNRKSKFPCLILLLSSLLELSNTTKLQQLFPCPASGQEVVWVVFEHTDIFCGFRFSHQFQASHDNLEETAKHESSEH